MVLYILYILYIMHQISQKRVLWEESRCNVVGMATNSAHHVIVRVGGNVYGGRRRMIG